MQSLAESRAQRDLATPGPAPSGKKAPSPWDAVALRSPNAAIPRLQRLRNAQLLSVLWLCSCGAPQRQDAPGATGFSPPDPTGTNTAAADAARRSALLSPAPRRRARSQPSVELTLDAESFSQPARAQTFWVSLRFRLPSQTHIYWSNPGESGLPTLAHFEVDRGLELGTPVYPGPTRFRGEAGATNYGYANELVIMAQARVRSEAELADGVTVRAHATWLACSDVCAPETGSASMTLSASHEEAPHGSPISAWLARRIRPLGEFVPAVAWLGTTLDLSSPERRIQEFFPYEPLPVGALDPAQEPTPAGLRVAFSPAWAQLPRSAVLRVASGETDAYFLVDL